jgi:hypothetical protein
MRLNGPYRVQKFSGSGTQQDRSIRPDGPFVLLHVPPEPTIQPDVD